MTTVCVGCGLYLDADGKLAVDPVGLIGAKRISTENDQRHAPVAMGSGDFQEACTTDLITLTNDTCHNMLVYWSVFGDAPFGQSPNQYWEFHMNVDFGAGFVTVRNNSIGKSGDQYNESYTSWEVNMRYISTLAPGESQTLRAQAFWDTNAGDALGKPFSAAGVVGLGGSSTSGIGLTAEMVGITL